MLVLILFCEEITVMVLNKAHCVDFCTLLVVYQFVFHKGMHTTFPSCICTGGIPQNLRSFQYRKHRHQILKELFFVLSTHCFSLSLALKMRKDCK